MLITVKFTSKLKKTYTSDIIPRIGEKMYFDKGIIAYTVTDIEHHISDVQHITITVKQLPQKGEIIEVN